MEKIKKEITEVEEQIELVNGKMREVAKRRDAKVSCMPREYYDLIKVRQAYEVKRCELIDELAGAKGKTKSVA